MPHNLLKYFFTGNRDTGEHGGVWLLGYSVEESGILWCSVKPWVVFGQKADVEDWVEATHC